ncbi:hypothetical protein [Asticcacaulis machinosus]|uniref:Uncharacterized protein n=1 Tax=Asticcacaulis machinosus TaxID=2984211 RepID=A0ABT5HHV0_9CAUL|nr:hypothetical protein [Asticcacaulis machinosus]MDC7675824.1 hypothetical protein [Asticcacaulis machinosus]
MKDGTELPRVYICEATSWYKYWGVWPEDDAGKKSIDLNLIAGIAASPQRLPASFANKLYDAGESGMGYTIFTVVFADGLEVAYGTGNAVDFIRYPHGKTAHDIRDVLPHMGRDTARTCPDYIWCLYSQ